MDEFIVIALLLVLILLSGPILGGVALSRTNKLRKEVFELRRILVNQTPPGQTFVAPPEKPDPATAPPETEKPDANAKPAEEETPVSPEAISEGPEEEPKDDDVGDRPPAVSATAATAAPKKSLEQNLTSRWMVWLGGIALALGGGFLVKFTFDAGLLGPTTRIVCGIILGTVLTIGGEWLRRRPSQRALANISATHIPAALTAAGIFTLFASLYAGYGLYGLISPAIAFALMGLVATAAVALSLLQGPMIAALGLLGGLINPLLVSSDTPQALVLFPYLLFIIGGSLAVSRYKDWPWLNWIALAGTTFWTLVWYLGAWQRVDVPMIAIFLCLLMAFFVTARHGVASLATEESPVLRGWKDLKHLDWVVTACALAVAVLLFMLIRLERYGPVSLTALGLMVAYFLYNARRVASLAALPVIGGLLTLATLALWHLPQIVTKRPYLVPAKAPELGFAPGSVLPPELFTFATVSVVFAAIFGFGAFYLLWGARRPGFWAVLSTTLPLAILTTAYWRIEAFEVGLSWTLISLALAGLYLAGASHLVRQEQKRGLDPDLLRGALGAFAVAVVSATTLAATTQLREAWLTIALAMQLPAMAWINHYLDLKALRKTALLLAGVVLARLVLNEGILDYGPITTPVFNWLLYGYGIPCLAFLAAAFQFRKEDDDLLVAVLETGALVFGVLLVTLEVRQLFSGGYLGNISYSLSEQATHNLAWLAMAFGLMKIHERHPRPVLYWGWRILAGWATLHLLAGAVLIANPLFTGDRVGEWHILNLLALSYGAPALLAALFAFSLRKQGLTAIANGAGVLVLLLLFVNLTLEIRHLFQGSQIAFGRTGDLEWYSYSLGWLLYAGLLLAAALATRIPALRYASLVIVLVTVGKVFLFDMAALTGLYRALSFIGLGGTLVGIGYLYQRFVFPPPASAPPAGDAETAEQA